MCRHNEDDCSCDDCCYQVGYDDALEGLPRDCEYKNWSQVNCYNDGYDQALIELSD